VITTIRYSRSREAWTMGPEATIEKKVCDYAKSLGVMTRKFVSPARRSVPDQILFYAGHCFFIEFKAPGKKASPAQEREMERLRAVGMRCFVCDDVEGGKFLIRSEMQYANSK
jgi:hypothetical protein